MNSANKFIDGVVVKFCSLIQRHDARSGRFGRAASEGGRPGLQRQLLRHLGPVGELLEEVEAIKAS